MRVRFYVDPETGTPHIHNHQVTEEEVADVLRTPMEDRPGYDGARVAIGQTLPSNHLYGGLEAEFGLLYHRLRSWPEGLVGVSAPPKEETMSDSKYPAGWDQTRVNRILEHYESQADDEAVAEDEAASEAPMHTFMEVPVDLVPAVRDLIAKRKKI
jgi:hypothetical protein